jgi:hypothetical protein
LTAVDVNVPRILFTTKVDSASPSTSSATMNRVPEAPITFSSSGSRSVIDEILPELIKMYGSSRMASIRSGSVTKYGDR